jgi:hypothetical protein
MGSDLSETKVWRIFSSDDFWVRSLDMFLTMLIENHIAKRKHSIAFLKTTFSIHSVPILVPEWTKWTLLEQNRQASHQPHSMLNRHFGAIHAIRQCPTANLHTPAPKYIYYSPNLISMPESAAAPRNSPHFGQSAEFAPTAHHLKPQNGELENTGLVPITVPARSHLRLIVQHFIIALRFRMPTIDGPIGICKEEINWGEFLRWEVI